MRPEIDEPNAMDFSSADGVPPNVITRGYGDIENDLGVVMGEIENLQNEIELLHAEKLELKEELENFEEEFDEDADAVSG